LKLCGGCFQQVLRPGPAWNKTRRCTEHTERTKPKLPECEKPLVLSSGSFLIMDLRNKW
jgi:hypothetical protein